MALIHLMVLFSLGLLFNFSQAKVCPGCAVKTDANEQAVYQYLSDKLNNDIPKGMEGEKAAQLVQVLNVKEQIVSGILHSYEFIAKGLGTNKLYECNLAVVRRAWKGEEIVTEYYCQEVPSNKDERPFLGGEVLLEITKNDKLEELKTFIAQEIGKVQESKYLMKVLKYFKASKQVVEGNLIKATVEVANTNCLLNEQSTSNNCQVLAEGHQVCDVHVWLKPWMKVKEVTEVQCRPQPKFCAGCPSERDVNDAVIQQCLKRTLSNSNAKSHYDENLSLVKINKVTSQVVTGIKYTIDFDAKEEHSGKLFTCKAVIISQPWFSEEPQVLKFKCTPTSD